MKSTDHCVEEQIEVVQGNGVRRKLAKTYSDFAVIIAEQRQYAIVHVPSGMVVAAENWGGFFTEEHACDAMIEISKLKNTWAFMEEDDWAAVREDIIRICRENGGGRTLAEREDVDALPNQLNGYDEDED